MKLIIFGLILIHSSLAFSCNDYKIKDIFNNYLHPNGQKTKDIMGNLLYPDGTRIFDVFKKINKFENVIVKYDNNVIKYFKFNIKNIEYKLLLDGTIVVNKCIP